MNVTVVKNLVENQSVEQLLAAEQALIQDLPLPITIEGKDESQQLTHALAAIWIKERMSGNRLGFKDALHEYIQQVRETIN
ncbi:MAG: hypothetical protein H7Y04_08315 [Verrucomicrobia bacterium]|nr:hypothetical protein [Cytophagales bacterium]